LYPDLKRDLYISNMDQPVERFIKNTILITLVFATIFMLVIAFILDRLNAQNFFLVVLCTYLVLLALIFYLVLKLPYFNKQQLGRTIEAEVAITGRRLLIQLQSGKSLMNSIIDVAKHKKESSKALERIAYELYMGKPLEQAINDAINDSPSRTFRKIFIQIRNSLKTGADVKSVLKATLEDITRQKIIEFETFGKRLNPIGLFYMIFGTIAPSLGVVMFAILLAIIGADIEIGILSVFLLLIAIIQFIFVTVFVKMRPELEI
jgi:pilus assembly protein TadC